MLIKKIYILDVLTVCPEEDEFIVDVLSLFSNKGVTNIKYAQANFCFNYLFSKSKLI